jgi:predicted DCC family thiol-disulfide oxidoreductase YuxK
MSEAWTTIYYDGLCHLCSREIDHYRRQKGNERIRFVDITGPDFDANKEGLDASKVHRELHVRRPDDSIAVGVDAFVAIWQTLPKYQALAKLAKLPGIHLTLRLGYSIFAQLRPLLPRRKADCRTSPYCETHQNHHNPPSKGAPK